MKKCKNCTCFYKVCINLVVVLAQLASSSGTFSIRTLKRDRNANVEIPSQIAEGVALPKLFLHVYFLVLCQEQFFARPPPPPPPPPASISHFSKPENVGCLGIIFNTLSILKNKARNAKPKGKMLQQKSPKFESQLLNAKPQTQIQKSKNQISKT